MKSYDSIEYYGKHWGLPVLAFDKLDGSNLRFEYSHKRGFYKFGSRKMMIDSNHEQFGFAVRLFLEKYADWLSSVFTDKQYRNVQSFVCFAELIGTQSAFGQHNYDSDTFDIVLFDVNAHKRGLLPPKEFVDSFGHLGIPEVVYEGNLNKELVQAVKRNEFNLTEGVICKGMVQTKKSTQPYYCKIKTDDWFERLKTKDPYLYASELKDEARTSLLV